MSAEQPLDFLDQIPDRLYQRLVTHSYRGGNSKTDSLKNRCLGVLELYQQLHQGRPVSEQTLASWLDEGDIHALLAYLTDDLLLTQAQGHPEFCDEVLLQLLDFLEQGELPRSRPSVDNASESHTSHQSPAVNADNNPDGSDKGSAPEASRSPLDASYHPAATDNMAAQALDSETARSLLIPADQHQIDQAMRGVHNALGIERHLGWDLSRGIRSQGDIKTLLKLHAKIRGSAYLQSILQMIGRVTTNRLAEQDNPGLKPQLKPLEAEGTSLQQLDEREHSLHSISGIYYGDDLSRLLPAEYALLGHPSLKSLWKARWADRQLLNYHIRGVLSSHVPEIQQHQLDIEESGATPVQQQGPMLLCIDTSASMKGKPELRAKAIALEAMRVASQQGRLCMLYAFSGPGEILELELALASSGWPPILDFLNTSFHGGTDLDGVLETAMQQMQDRDWQDADLLLISDGRFKLRHQHLLESFKHFHPQLRIFGMQVGQWQSTAFSDICHRVFNFNHV